MFGRHVYSHDKLLFFKQPIASKHDHNNNYNLQQRMITRQPFNT